MISITVSSTEARLSERIDIVSDKETYTYARVVAWSRCVKSGTIPKNNSELNDAVESALNATIEAKNMQLAEVERRIVSAESERYQRLATVNAQIQAAELRAREIENKNRADATGSVIEQLEIEKRISADLRNSLRYAEDRARDAEERLRTAAMVRGVRGQASPVNLQGFTQTLDNIRAQTPETAATAQNNQPPIVQGYPKRPEPGHMGGLEID